MERSTHRITTNRLLLALLLILCLPSVAQANVIITPLNVGCLLHLFIGNALIGILEGCLLFWLARTPKIASVFLMIFANYISSWLGFFILGWFQQQFSRTIETVQVWFWMFVLIAFLLTVLIEFPFVLMMLWKNEHKLRKSIWITLVINAVSYVLICGWYLKYSEVSAVTGLSVVPVGELQLPDGYVLYFVSPDDKSVFRCDLTGNNVKKVKTLETQEEPGWLFARRSQEPADPSYDLFFYLNRYGPDEGKEELIEKRFSSSCVVLLDPSTEEDSAESSDSWRSMGMPQLNTSGKWQYYLTGSFSLIPSNGIRGENIQDGVEFRFSLDTPFDAWRIHHPNHFEGDFVLFQLDEDQICILHPQTKKIALITRGKSPIVAKAKEAEE